MKRLKDLVKARMRRKLHPLQALAAARAKRTYVEVLKKHTIA